MDSPGDSDDDYARRLAEVTLGEPERLSGAIELRPYDASWPEAYDREAARIADALGARALVIEHVGSTSVPGLIAKPIIDIVLEVADSADEDAYVPDLVAGGFVLRIREPEWFEHRLFKPDAGGRAVNLHVFSAGCPETARMLGFRDLLRSDEVARERYAARKRELADRGFTYMQQYADAKTDVIGAILAERRS